MKRWFIVAAALVVSASTAVAQPQVILRWDDCSVAGTATKTFACNTNSGATFDMFQSVIAPAGLQTFVGFLSVMDVQLESGLVADSWWSFGSGTGFCRLTTSAGVTQTAGTTSCADITNSTFTFGQDYSLNSNDFTNRGRLRVLGAFSADEAIALPTDTEMTICKIGINRQRTTGSPSCGGCLTPACIVFQSVLLDTRTVGEAQTVSGGPLNSVSWQATPTGFVCPDAVPTQSRTWGSIKSLYR